MIILARSVATAAMLASGAAAQDDGADVWLVSYEVIPSAQNDMKLETATYAEKAEVAAAALEAISPRVATAVGIDPTALETDLTPGGFLLQTNPSLQTRGAMAEDDAVRLAAALGYVFRQWSVLVSRPDNASGDTGYVSVAFPEDALTPEAAQAFFLAAAAADEGLGGGYTAFGDEMIFLNVRDADHQPYSGLEDVAFAAKLGAAAGGFDGAALSVAGAGYARALFVGNDWETAPNGEAYAATVGDAEALRALEALRIEHAALVERMGAEFGWR
jgi:hypothetical protein